MQDSDSYEYVSMKNLNESKYGFWGTLARKAKSFVDNDDTNNQFQALERNPHQTFDRSTVDRVRIKSWILLLFAKVWELKFCHCRPTFWFNVAVK